MNHHPLQTRHLVSLLAAPPSVIDRHGDAKRIELDVAATEPNLRIVLAGDARRRLWIDRGLGRLRMED